MDRVELFEVGPRDGLQNEKVPVPEQVKLGFIRDLYQSGLVQVEATSFVSAKWVPQMADASAVTTSLVQQGCDPWVLVPNLVGLSHAVAAGARSFAFLTATSASFLQANLKMSWEENIHLVGDLVASAREQVPGCRVRVYVSTVIECPYEGKVSPSRLESVVALVARTRPDQVSLGETIGVAVPGELLIAASAVESVWPMAKAAWHLHDTRGTAVAGALALVERGYRAFDSSAGGLGGCPYAPGAGGNVATEDLVYAFERSGLTTGVDLRALSKASLPVLRALGLEPASKAQRAVLASL